MSEDVLPTRKWNNCLYNNRGLPDNYVDSDFLSELKENLVFLPRLQARSVIIAAGSIYQQLCCLSLFVVIYFYLLFDWISPKYLNSCLLFLIAAGYAMFWLMKEVNEREFHKVPSLISVISEIKSGVVFFTFCFLLAPILHSLLSSVSTDSIYAMCFFFLVVYWTCFDYRTHWKGHPRKPGSNTISLSSALLAALCLASRLPGPYHTFALLSTVVTLLALWPTLTRRFRNHGGDRAQICLTILSGSVTILSAWPIVYNKVSFEYKCVFLCVLVMSTVCINFVGPCYLLRMQKFKRFVSQFSI
ncbi:Phosphatidylinositol N-acetylglucosaminyltransferase subunit C [Schistosoma japonicum]|nr:Phosphatidylinositol N-acetylglucosaminyltransferase subunit C [Schistosoma japonicum]